MILIPFVTLAIGLTACSTSQGNSEKKETKVASAAVQTDLKRPLVKFFMDLSNKINEKDADLNVYESKDQPTPEMKAKASLAAAAVAEQLNQIQIPSDLKNQKTEIEAAIKDFADSYQTIAEELKKDTPSLDKANATFAQGEEKLGKVFKEGKLGKPNLSNAVN